MAGSAFVTRGSGFIGGALVRRLVRDGWNVRGLARSEESAEKVRSLGAGFGAPGARGQPGREEASTAGVVMIAVRISSVALVLAVVVPFGGASAQTPPVCAPPPEAMTFAPQTYVDTTRAGGEPTVEQLPDGTMLYGGHASTTLLYAPAAADPDSTAYVNDYTGQTYVWWSADRGATWTFVPRRTPPDNLPLSGFSDPEWAVDSAGNAFYSEINLANVGVSKSADSGRSFTLQNFFGQTLTDRQWMAADEENVLYIAGNALGGGTFPTMPAGNVGHFLYKSTDGGKTFDAGRLDEEGGEGLGDLQVDQSDGTLYEAHYDGETLSMAAFRGIRGGDFTPDTNTVAEGVDMLSHWPSFDLDPAGNLYITWDESGDGARAAGVWFSYSTDRGETWAEPTRVDSDDRTDIWPWLAAGDDGRVAVAWLQADVALPNQDAQTPGDHGWRVVAAQTLNGHGCAESAAPGFAVATATPEPVHTGTICQGGTACQAQLIDRRMGDFFTIEIDDTGRMWAGYSDTRRGGMVALPAFVRQQGGPSFLAP